MITRRFALKLFAALLTGCGVPPLVRDGGVADAVPGVAPYCLVEPGVHAMPVVGQPLTCTTGAWRGAPDPTYTYQWYVNGSAVSGATSATYTPTFADYGLSIFCRVTATNASGTATQDSNTLSTWDGPALTYASGTFSRALAAYYRTGALSSGTIYAQAATGVLRSENIADGAGPLYLFEGARTNIVLHSRDRTQSAWSAGSGTTTTHTATGADGTSVGVREQVTSGGYSIFQSPISPGATAPAACSLWIRAGGASTSYRTVSYDGTDFQETASATGLTSSWQRVHCDATSGALVSIVPVDGRAGSIVAAARDVISDFPQVESGRFPSSPIVTAGSQTTRPADTLTYTSGQVPSGLLTSAHAFTNVRPLWGYDDTADGDEFWLLSLGGSSNGIRFRRSSGSIKLEAVSGGSVVAYSYPIVPTAGELIGQVVWDPSAGRVAVNGSPGPAGTAWTWSSAALRVGGVYGGANEAFCGLSEIYESEIPDEPESRLVVAVVVSQSNASGVDSLKSGAPATHTRNDSRCFKVNASNVIVTADESLHEGYDPYLGASDGFSFVKVAVNEWLDAHTSSTAIIVPRATGSTLITTSWAISPESTLTKRGINDTIRVLRSSDQLVIMVLMGEGAALVGGTEASNFAANLSAWLSHFRTRVGRASAPAIICQLPDPGPGYNDWDTVQAQISTLASATSPVQIVVTNPSSINNLHYNASEQTALGLVVGSALSTVAP